MKKTIILILGLAFFTGAYVQKKGARSAPKPAAASAISEQTANKMVDYSNTVKKLMEGKMKMGSLEVNFNTVSPGYTERMEYICPEFYP